VGIYWKPEKAATGDATEKNHVDWIKLSSASFGSGRSITTLTGRAADREAGTAQMSEMTITKDLDAASMNLFKAACVGNGEKMEFHVTRAGTLDDKSEVVYLKYILENALVTSFASQSTGGKPVETLTINFGKLTMTYTPQDPAAADASPITVAFNQCDTTGQA
jgi:type VI secretion system secreted protein Hcp